MTRLCLTCRRHEAIRDGRDCADCTNAYLRATRPIHEPAWRTWTREHNAAKDMTRSAA